MRSTVVVLVVAGCALVSTGARANTWINSLGGAWSDGANWAEHNPPGPGGSADLTAFGTYDVVLDEDVDLARITIGGSGSNVTLDVGGHALTVDPGVGVLVNAGSTLLLETALSTLAATVNGGFVDVLPQGTLDVAGNTTLTGNLTIAVDGTVLVEAPATLTMNAATVEVRNAGAFELEGAVAAGSGGGSFTVDAGGALTKSDAGTATLAVASTVHGAVSSQGGTMNVTATMTASGATLSANGGALTFVAAPVLSNVTFDGDPNAPACHIVAGATFAGTTRGFGLSIDGGTVAGLVALSSADVTWTAGAIQGANVTLDAASTLRLRGTGLLDVRASSVSSSGVIDFGSGALRLQGGTTLTIGAGGSLLIGGDLTIDQAQSGAVFVDAGGALVKTAGAQTAHIKAALDDVGGAVEADSGTLSIEGTYTENGTVTALAGAHVVIATATTATLDDATFACPAGACTFTGPDLALQGVLTLVTANGGLTLANANATYGGASGFSVAGPGTLTVQGGTFVGSLDIESDAALSLSGGVTFDHVAMSNEGAVDVRSGALSLSGGSVDNAGTFTLHDNTSITTPSTSLFVNDVGGRLAASAALGPASIAAGVDVENEGGTIAASEGTFSFGAGFTQSSGTTSLEGGTVATLQNVDVTLAGGTLVGTGSIAGVDDTGGTVSPGGNNVGTITVDGALTQGAASTWRVDVAGASSFDVVDVNGAATLGGALHIVRRPSFVPAPTDSFRIATFASSTGSFASITGDVIGDGLGFVVKLNANDITLLVAQEICDNGIDDDGDNLVDAADPKCTPIVAGEGEGEGEGAVGEGEGEGAVGEGEGEGSVGEGEGATGEGEGEGAIGEGEGEGDVGEPPTGCGCTTENGHASAAAFLMFAIVLRVRSRSRRGLGAT